jgi:NMD protein affecting ribosome stability and mRNA decay
LDHDPYHAKAKLKEPCVCQECGAVYRRGRWMWGEAEAGAQGVLCPACQRVRDRVPAAFLSVSGDFFSSHRDLIVRLIHNIEQRERKQHPMKRIMGSEEQAGGLSFTFTDAHLARGVGKALHDAYQGKLDYTYTKEDVMLRVSWSR